MSRKEEDIEKDDTKLVQEAISRTRQMNYMFDYWKKFRIVWQENHAWPVFYSTLVANILLLNMGITLGYASPAIPDLLMDDEVTSISDTSFVFSAAVPLGVAIGGPLSGYFLDKLGRHMTLMISVVPYAIGWVLIMVTCVITGYAFLPVLYVGRFFTGVGLGFSITGVPCYVAELSPSALRGLFVGLFGISVGTGILLIQLCGVIPGVRYYWLPVVPLTTLVIFVFLMALTTKETPRWLLQTNRKSSARLVMLWLRGKNYDVDKELSEINELISKERKQNILKSFKQKSIYFPVFVGCCLVAFPHISGNTAVIFYSKVIFSNVSEVSDYAGVVSAACVGGGQLAGAILMVLLVDKFGRRKLLLWGAIAMCSAALALGIYYIFNSKPYCDPDSSKCVNILAPLSLIGVTMYSASFQAAWAGLPYLVAAEIIPLQVRGVGMGMVTFFGWSSAAICLLIYEPYQNAVTLWAPFITFAIIMFCAILFVYKLVPETKGKTLEQTSISRNEEQKPNDNTELSDKSAPLTEYGTLVNFNSNNM